MNGLDSFRSLRKAHKLKIMREKELAVYSCMFSESDVLDFTYLSFQADPQQCILLIWMFVGFLWVRSSVVTVFFNVYLFYVAFSILVKTWWVSVIFRSRTVLRMDAGLIEGHDVSKWRLECRVVRYSSCSCQAGLSPCAPVAVYTYKSIEMLPIWWLVLHCVPHDLLLVPSGLECPDPWYWWMGMLSIFPFFKIMRYGGEGDVHRPKHISWPGFDLSLRSLQNRDTF